MKNDQLLEMIERYLAGEMNPEERGEFEALRTKDANVEAKLEEHRHFTGLLKQFNERHNMELRLNAIHDEIDVHTMAEDLMAHPSLIVRLWRQHHSKISVAASIAIFAMLLTLFFTGNLTNKDPRVEQLKREVDKVKSDQQILKNGGNRLFPKQPKAGPTIIAKYRGTGFALSSNGYILTNFHVVNGADSVYVQNADGESFHTKIIATDAEHDMAVLQINDPAFKNLGAVPYGFKKGKSDLAEDVYTLGYPTDAAVFGEGALTSDAGFHGDTAEYMVSVPVNPGNSGGPLFDSKGNVIGIISGRQTQTQGVAFAKKSAFILKAIKDIPADSLKTKDITLNAKGTLAGLSRKDQVKKLKNYVFIVKVYNQ
ncbi:S1C family serine protease [Mucilaginibacter pedocola]|uniref:Protease Do n=1 Tax=Mucilaginibacter pedocola TaxID=1792845 RepID=A0A1S9PFG8_9SPHI|nr:serine protease [Mucilaginibacter pedocola]OOQ59667.1 protease Do [Mucilaginibacter pedocola]